MIETLKNLVPLKVKDIKLNLSSVLNETGVPGVSLKQIYQIALSNVFA